MSIWHISDRYATCSDLLSQEMFKVFDDIWLVQKSYQNLGIYEKPYMTNLAVTVVL